MFALNQNIISTPQFPSWHTEEDTIPNRPRIDDSTFLRSSERLANSWLNLPLDDSDESHLNQQRNSRNASGAMPTTGGSNNRNGTLAPINERNAPQFPAWHYES